LRPKSEGLSSLEQLEAGWALPLMLGSKTSFCSDESVGTLMGVLLETH